MYMYTKLQHTSPPKRMLVGWLTSKEHPKMDGPEKAFYVYKQHN